MGLRCVCTVQRDIQLDRKRDVTRDKERTRRRGKRKRGWKEEKNERNADCISNER